MANADPEALELVRRVRAHFPDDASRTDMWLIERGWGIDDLPHIWVEAFADRTSDAVRIEDWPRVREHTEFMAAEYRTGSQVVRSVVDVSYAENLMWDLDKPLRVRAWPHIAQEVRRLYKQMWGVPES